MEPTPNPITIPNDPTMEPTLNPTARNQIPTINPTDSSEISNDSIKMSVVSFIFTIIGVIIGVLLLVIGGYFCYKHKYKNSDLMEAMEMNQSFLGSPQGVKYNV